MSKITNDGLTWSGTECFIGFFIAVLIWKQWASKGYTQPQGLHVIRRSSWEFTWQMVGAALAEDRPSGAATADDDEATDIDPMPKSSRVRLIRCPGSARTRHGESMLPQPVSSVT